MANKNANVLDARIDEIMEWVVSNPIPTTWRTNSVFPSPGERKSRSRGSDGYDFAAHVEYTFEDDPRDIDWFATAATGGQQVIVEQKFEPHDSRFFVLADVGTTMGFGSYRTTKRGLATELTGSIILSAAETADRVGFVVYDDHSSVHVQQPRSAKTVLYPALASIVQYDEDAINGKIKEPKDKSVTGLQLALDTVSRYSRSLVFILSDFMNMTEGDVAMLNRVASHHDVVCIMVQDLRERELPQGILFGYGFYTFQDMRTGERKTVWLTPHNRRQFNTNFVNHEKRLIEIFQKCDCDWEVISTEEGLAAHPKLLQLFANHRK